MAAARQIHVYGCANCRATYMTTIPTQGTGTPYRCLNDRSPMHLLHSLPIDTEGDFALAARCPVWNGGRTTVTPGPRFTCDHCRRSYPVDRMIDLGAGGKYCRQEHADAGSEKHRAALERTQALVEELHKEMPWLKKETA